MTTQAPVDKDLQKRRAAERAKVVENLADKITKLTEERQALLRRFRGVRTPQQTQAAVLDIGAARNLTTRDVLSRLGDLYMHFGFARIPSEHERGLVEEALDTIWPPPPKETIPEAAVPSLSKPAGKPPVTAPPVEDLEEDELLDRACTRIEEASEAQLALIRDLTTGVPDGTIIKRLGTGLETLSLEKSKLFSYLGFASNLEMTEKLRLLRIAARAAGMNASAASVATPVVVTKAAAPVVHKDLSQPLAKPAPPPVAKGRQPQERALSDAAIADVAEKTRALYARLPPGQIELAAHIAEGMGDAEIAKQTSRSVGAVSVTKNTIYNRLDLMGLSIPDRVAVLAKLAKLAPVVQKEEGIKAPDPPPAPARVSPVKAVEPPVEKAVAMAPEKALPAPHPGASKTLEGVYLPLDGSEGKIVVVSAEGFDPSFDLQWHKRDGYQPTYLVVHSPAPGRFVTSIVLLKK